MIIYLQIGLFSYIGCGEPASDPSIKSPEIIDTGDDAKDTSSSVDTSVPQDTNDTDTPDRDFLFVDEIAAGTIFVTEIMKDPLVDADYGEWFEIFNSSPNRINLVDLIIKDDGGDEFVVDQEVYIEPMDHFVFGTDSNASMNGGVTVDYQYDRSTFALGNGDDEIGLFAGGSELDVVRYDVSFPNMEGVALSLNAVYYSGSNNDTSTNWCEAGDSIERAEDGGGADEDCMIS